MTFDGEEERGSVPHRSHLTGYREDSLGDLCPGAGLRLASIDRGVGDPNLGS